MSEEKSNPDTVKSASAESTPFKEGCLEWDIYNPDSIMEACSRFLSMKKTGYSFYKLLEEDGSKSYVFDFDQNYPKIYFIKDQAVQDQEYQIGRVGIKISL